MKITETHRSTRLIVGATSALATLFIALGTLVTVSVGISTALPSACTFDITVDEKGVTANCGSGTGRYQAVAVCRDPDTGTTTNRRGQPQESGIFSIAFCLGSERAVDSSIIIEN